MRRIAPVIRSVRNGENPSVLLISAGRIGRQLLQAALPDSRLLMTGGPVSGLIVVAVLGCSDWQ